jgi:hypothetical protein
VSAIEVVEAVADPECSPLASPWPGETPIASELRVAGPWRHFVRHFVEMVVAMAVGMVVLGPAVKPLTGQFDVFQRTDLSVLVMATNMTIGMSLWMRYRRHGWASIAEMGAAMYVPFAVLLVPYWAGLLPGGMLMIAGHVLMLPAMAAAMWRRRGEYMRGHTR